MMLLIDLQMKPPPQKSRTALLRTKSLTAKNMVLATIRMNTTAGSSGTVSRESPWESISCVHNVAMIQKPPCLILLLVVATSQGPPNVEDDPYVMNAMKTVRPHQPSHQTAPQRTNILTAKTLAPDGFLMSSTAGHSGIA